MKQLLMIILTSFALGILNPLLAADAPGSAERLLKEFQTALAAKDQPAILHLFYWQGVNAEMKSFTRQIATEWIKPNFKNVQLAPFPKTYPVPFDTGGVHYSFNLEPLGVIEVDVSPAKAVLPPLAYGQSGGVYYIATLTEKVIIVTDTNAGPLITINVESADGKPLRDVPVISANPASSVSYELNTFIGGTQKYWTDDQGRFRLSIFDKSLFLLSASEAGFGWMQNSNLSNNAIMVLQPWGRIEGVRLNRRSAVSNEHLKLSPDRDFYGDGAFGSAPGWMNSLMAQECTTDAQGRFAFARVPPLKVFIDRSDQRGVWGYFWPADARAGGTTKLNIVTRGRIISGQVKASSELNGNISVSSLSIILKSKFAGREGSRRTVSMAVSADGSFQSDRVEPGDYTVCGDIRQDNRFVALVDPIVISILDDVSGGAEMPLDIGTVILRPAVNLMKGDLAPEITCQTLDSKPLKLSNYRGKYVLLDFWATWCGPCVAETPNLKAAYDEFGKDNRLVLLSLSLDLDTEAPKKFTRLQGITWPQGFLGKPSTNKEVQLYTVYGIPAIYLIDPEGKILASGLRGDLIKKTIAAALAGGIIR